MKTAHNTVFISGGSAGIGLAIAKKFSSQGNKVIINGRNKERLEQALQELDNAVAIAGDLSVEADRLRIAQELAANHPDLNILVNNAGAAFVYTLGENAGAHDKALQEISTNYLAPIHFTELLLPQLLQQEQAAIVNITSIAALQPAKVLPTYAASKAALHSYTTALRLAYAEHSPLEVYEVYPPLVNTEFSKAIGGENGIAPAEVADELFEALALSKYEVPVGVTKELFK
ncbi:MAG: SDR family NAD(P)-dependent oxidoreductase [Candidatus Pseudobacter hemicellulosilyticus]|uniref:SDR family NAD(P)-dependent oxidoreductase n=1 Tax=Candidatus Pseudobacter hemicellulosilyticus TaxID=3121375 RepID=A0AAJ6BHX4_9BACT|nr:MAG: SDR family NAD(P)-dependent oxidoreductase [Pseudobacter sp.]